MRIHRLHIIAVNKCLVKEGRIIDNNLKVMVENSGAGRNSSLPSPKNLSESSVGYKPCLSQLEQMQWYMYEYVWCLGRIHVNNSQNAEQCTEHHCIRSSGYFWDSVRSHKLWG